MCSCLMTAKYIVAASAHTFKTYQNVCLSDFLPKHAWHMILITKGFIARRPLNSSPSLTCHQSLLCLQRSRMREWGQPIYIHGEGLRHCFWMGYVANHLSIIITQKYLQQLHQNRGKKYESCLPSILYDFLIDCHVLLD